MAQPGKMIDLIKGKAKEVASPLMKKMLGEKAEAADVDFVTARDWDFEPGYPKMAISKKEPGWVDFIYNSKGYGVSYNMRYNTDKNRPSPSTEEVLKDVKNFATWHKNLTSNPDIVKDHPQEIRERLAKMNEWEIKNKIARDGYTKADTVYLVQFDKNDKIDPSVEPIPIGRGRNPVWDFMKANLN